MDFNENIEKFLEDVDINDSVSFQTLSTAFCQYICETYNKSYTNDNLDLFTNSIIKYKNGEIDFDGLISEIEINFDIKIDYYGNSVPQGHRINTSAQITSTSHAVIDVDVDTIEYTSQKYSELVTKLDLININPSIPFIERQYSLHLKSEFMNKKQLIISYLDEIKDEIINDMRRISMIDDSIGDAEFNDISYISSAYRSTGTTIRRADASFFRNAGYTVTNNVVEIDGYSYNLTSGELTSPDGTEVTVRYYVPTNYSELSKLNTVTCLAGQREADIDTTTGDNSFFMNDISTNSILVVPSKSTYDNENQKNTYSYASMSSGVIASTRFARTFSHQESGCTNTIIGCSNGGGSAMKIAGEAGELYDTVVCVNYAPFFIGDNRGYVNDKGVIRDDNRLTDSDIAGLSGKTILFISSSGDDNFSGGENSYFYRGVQRLIRSCPNTYIYLSTNGNKSSYNSLAASNSNFIVLNDEFWNSTFTGSYSGHPSYHDMFRDVINSGILGRNNYNT